MTYRGYHTKTEQQKLGSVGRQMTTAIFLGERRMAFVATDRELIKRVIDQKIKEGVWPDGQLKG